jgi:hypothetical protein
MEVEEASPKYGEKETLAHNWSLATPRRNERYAASSQSV